MPTASRGIITEWDIFSTDTYYEPIGLRYDLIREATDEDIATSSEDYRDDNEKE